MNLYIIRHGESTWNNQNRIQGNSNPELSKLGRLQAKLLAKRFRRIKVDKIYSSPLLRAFQTAQIISRTLKVKIIKKGQLKEVGLGEWEGRTPDEINRLYDNRYEKWLRVGPTNIRIPHSEDIASFRKRVKKVFYEIIDKNKKKDVMVITHGGVIASFLSHILDADFDKLILSLHLPNTCMTLISFHKKRSCLIHIADTFHLKSEPKGVWPAR